MMSAARIIYPPMSGRDRRHFSRELKKGEQEHARLADEAGAPMRPPIGASKARGYTGTRVRGGIRGN
jgi:hypothetical protein